MNHRPPTPKINQKSRIIMLPRSDKTLQNTEKQENTRNIKKQHALALKNRLKNRSKTG